MTLNFTEQELLRLLLMVQIGDWVKHSSFEGDWKINEDLQQDKKVMQKLLSAVFKSKLVGLVEYDMKGKEYKETLQLEGMFMPCMDEFNEDQFWEQLADRLAQRDMILKYSEKGMAKMDNLDRAFENMEIAKAYEEMFSKDGLMNLKLQEG